jgi:hypothetical protein
MRTVTVEVRAEDDHTEPPTGPMQAAKDAELSRDRAVTAIRVASGQPTYLSARSRRG